MTCLGPGRNFASDPVDDEQGDGGDGGESQRLSSGASESQLTDAQLNNGTLLLVCTPQYMQLMLSTIRHTDVCSPRCDSNSLVGRVTKRARRAKELLEASNSHTSNTNSLDTGLAVVAHGLSGGGGRGARHFVGCSAWRYLSQPYDYEHVAVFEEDSMQLAVVNCAPDPVRVLRCAARCGTLPWRHIAILTTHSASTARESQHPSPSVRGPLSLGVDVDGWGHAQPAVAADEPGW